MSLAENDKNSPVLNLINTQYVVNNGGILCMENLEMKITDFIAGSIFIVNGSGSLKFTVYFLFVPNLFIYYLKNCSLTIIITSNLSPTILSIISVQGYSSNTTLENFNYSSDQFTEILFPLIESQGGQINIVNLSLKTYNILSSMTFLSFTNSSAFLMDIHSKFLKF